MNTEKGTTSTIILNVGHLHESVIKVRRVLKYEAIQMNSIIVVKSYFQNVECNKINSKITIHS